MLRAVDYGERDRIVTLFTREHGKLSAFAAGARGSRKRFVAAFEPFVVLRVALVAGRGELWRLREASVERAFPALLRELERMSAAAAGLELVREAMPEHAVDAGVLDEVVALFEALGAGAPPHASAVDFVLRVLLALGHAPRLDACAICGRPRPAARSALFDPARGGVVCQSCGGGPLRLSAPSLDRMQRALDGEVGEWGEAELAEIGPALVAHARAQIGKELPCLALLAKVPPRTP